MLKRAAVVLALALSAIFAVSQRAQAALLIDWDWFPIVNEVKPNGNVVIDGQIRNIGQTGYPRITTADISYYSGLSYNGVSIYAGYAYDQFPIPSSGPDFTGLDIGPGESFDFRFGEFNRKPEGQIPDFAKDAPGLGGYDHYVADLSITIQQSYPYNRNRFVSWEFSRGNNGAGPVVPEPSSMVLFGMGFLGMGGIGASGLRRRSKQPILDP